MTARRRQPDGHGLPDVHPTEEFDHGEVGSRVDDPPEDDARRLLRALELLRQPAGEAVESLRAGVDDRADDQVARPVTAQAMAQGGDVRVGDVGDEDRRAVADRGRADPGFEGGADRAEVREDVGVVPLERRQDDDRRPVRIEVAGVLVGLDDEGIAVAPARRWPVDRR